VQGRVVLLAIASKRQQPPIQLHEEVAVSRALDFGLFEQVTVEHFQGKAGQRAHVHLRRVQVGHAFAAHPERDQCVQERQRP